MQDRPMCWVCPHPVDDPVFEAPCGHDGCSSVVFHGICLMRWRETRDEQIARFKDSVVILFERRSR